MPQILSKNDRVLALIAVMALASFVVGGVVYAVSSGNAAELAAMSTRIGALHGLADRIAEDVDDQEAALGDFVLTRSPIALGRFNEAVADELAAAEEFRTIAVGLPSADAPLDAVETASGDWRTRVAEPAIAAARRNTPGALDSFVDAAGEDVVFIDEALGRLDRELGRAQTDYSKRKAEIDRTTLIGVIIGFSFMISAFGVALVAVRRFGHALERDTRDAGVLNRFTEKASFASDDREVAAANLVALGRLAHPDASVTHILNRSLDRAVPEALTGDPIAEVLPLGALSRCAGVVRGTMYVTDDLADELSVRCPIYPASNGTLACVPLISGESVGAVHLYWRRPNSLPLARRSSIARITEHAALAIGNRRLMIALHGQANTDARTGLPNSRAFDVALESALAARADDEALSVLMLDVDQFKQFNDRHGHPAGDEALRAFADILRSCMREGDFAARYGGEEFAVCLPGVEGDAALAIAERIRGRTEMAIISLAPGLTDRITISIGVASAPDHGHDRVTLLRLADEALYQAKERGRNRVVSVTDMSGSASPDDLSLGLIPNSG